MVDDESSNHHSDMQAHSAALHTYLNSEKTNMRSDQNTNVSLHHSKSLFVLTKYTGNNYRQNIYLYTNDIKLSIF